ncbi:serine/threonine-protein kinase [Nocardia salmonicida]|uniref:serine/threonine-protein kinase n=1 Tax=Nocardia salmonicida TaxID=53431 RepID=UPI00364B51A3
MPVRPGTVISGHRILRLLGAGASGAVYLARQQRLDRDVALKVLHAAYANDDTVRVEFDREARLIAQLDHTNIVAVHDRNSSDDDYLWLSMRYIAGGDLADAISAAPGGLDPVRVARLITDAAHALDHAHSRNVLHRDVKPHNILVERTSGGERAVLTDFGIARALGATLTAASVVGSLGYAAPERFTRDRHLDGRSDVYSLGCTMFHLLTGSLPFPTADSATAIAAHLNEPPPSVRRLRPELPAYLDHVVAAALAKQPDQRYTTCTELATNLTRAVTATVSLPSVQPPYHELIRTSGSIPESPTPQEFSMPLTRRERREQARKQGAGQRRGAAAPTDSNTPRSSTAGGAGTNDSSIAPGLRNPLGRHGSNYASPPPS